MNSEFVLQMVILFPNIFINAHNQTVAKPQNQLHFTLLLTHYFDWLLKTYLQIIQQKEYQQ